MPDSQPSPAESAPPGPFIPPSIHHTALLSGATFTHYSALPPTLSSTTSSSGPIPTQDQEEFILGVDEAGRGPVLGPMVYAVFYLPKSLSTPLLRETHHFDDSKVLTAATRTSLMRTLCDPDSDLYASCGWATKALSARDISANMLRAGPTHNLNAQAMDATVELIKGVMAKGVNVKEIYVDTIGPPASYQAKLQRFFPTVKMTVAKKADSLYPCVSAASVCAKVTRDVALEVLYDAFHRRGANLAEGDGDGDGGGDDESAAAWGSGYPSDARCVSWLRSNMHPVFGWGPECRQSWGTAKDMLEGKTGVRVDWPADDDGETARVTDYFGAAAAGDGDELGTWYGTPAGLEAF